MSGLRGPWKVLDLAPTEDIRAIRRAYAVRLKAIDPDTDPQAFRALREAFEQAQREAEWIGREDEEVDWAPDLADTETEDAPLGEKAPPPLEPTPTPASPWAPPAPADVDAHARALAELLLGDHADRWPSAEEEEAMQRHWAAISTDPRMEQMSFFADVEQWAAGLIARSAPFSDPIARAVGNHFQWGRSEGDVHRSPAIVYVTKRCRMLEFFDSLRDKRHELHRAFVELTTPANERSRRGWVSSSKVRRLLWLVRHRFPDLEGNFDFYRVSMWENPQDYRAKAPFWAIPAILVLTFVVLAILFPGTESSSPERPYPVSVSDAPLKDERADNERALHVLFSGEMPTAKVEATNPELQALLHDQWMEAKRFRFRFDAYVGTLRAALAARYAQVRFDAAFPLLVEMRQIELAVLKSLRARSPEACARTLGGDFTDDELTVDQLMQRRALMIRVLLETQTGGKIPQSRGFTLSRAEVEKIAQKAGLDPERFSRALRREGYDAEKCIARIAMLEAALAMPRKTGEAVLRGL